MRKKRLIILCSVLSAFAVLIILASTVFMLQSVTVNFVTQTTILNESQASEIAESGKFKMGSNVLFTNFKKEAANIEAANPFVKVVKIERKFPNKVIVHVAERTPACYVVVDANAYVFDSDFKVLAKYPASNMQTDETIPASIAAAPKLSGLSISSNLDRGQFENNQSAAQIIKAIETAMLRLGGSILDLENIIFENSDGFKIKIYSDNNTNNYLEISGIDNLQADCLGGLTYYFGNGISQGNGKVAKIGGEWQFVNAE